MAVVFLDGFDLVSDRGTQVSSRYDFTTGFVSSINGRIASSLSRHNTTESWGWEFTGVTGGTLGKAVSALSGGVVGIGVRFPNVVNTGSTTLPGFRDSVNSNVVALTAGASTVGAGSHNTLTLFISAVSIITFATLSNQSIWHRVEIEAGCGQNNSGYARIYVSGTLLLSWASTISNAFARAVFGGVGNNPGFDDFYVLDSGTPGPVSALGSTFLIRTLRPTADTSVSQWTPLSAGTALWSSIDELGTNGHDSAGTYIHTSTVSQITVVDIAKYSSVSGWALSASEVPMAVQVTLCAQAPSGTASIRTKLILNSGASANGTTSTAAASFAYHVTPHNVDPQGASWTLEVISNLQIGMEYVS